LLKLTFNRKFAPQQIPVYSAELKNLQSTKKRKSRRKNGGISTQNDVFSYFAQNKTA
jgi:hypothetical protein